MSLPSFLGYLAGGVAAVEFLVYIISIVKGRSKPERATWLIYSLVGGIIFFSYHSAGAVQTIWVALIYFLAPLIVALLSIKYGVGGWTLLDKLCLSGSVAGLFLWFIFDSPLLALYINILIDFFGLIPTVFKTYINPNSEDTFAWFLGFLASAINLFAIDNFDFAVVLYPVYMIGNTGIIFFLTLRKYLKSSQL